MPKLIKVLEEYYEQKIDNDSNNSNEAWENRRDNWVEKIINDYMDEEGFTYLGSLGGKSKSVAKKEASRENGKKGGRPKKLKV